MLLKGIVHQMGLCWQRLTVRTYSDGQLEIILDLFTRILLFGTCLSHGSPARSFVRINLCAPIRPSVHLPIEIPRSYAFALSARSQSPPMAHCDWMQNLFLSPLLQAQVACSQEITRNKTCHPPPRGRFTHDTADIANRQSSIFTQCTRGIKLRMTTLPAGASHPLL